MVTALGIACLQLTEKILWVKDQYMCLGGNIGPVKISLWCGQDAERQWGPSLAPPESSPDDTGC